MDVNDVPSAVWNVTGVVGMFAGLFWMLATDRMVTGPAHRRELAERDKRIALQDATIESLTVSVQKNTLNGELAVSLLRSIDRTAAEKAGDA